MSPFARLAAIALRSALNAAGQAAGVGNVGGTALDFLTDRFTDQSLRVEKAVQVAAGRAWTTPSA